MWRCVCVPASLALGDPTTMTYNSRWQPVIHISLQASLLKLLTYSPITSHIRWNDPQPAMNQKILSMLPQERKCLAAVKNNGSFQASVSQPSEGFQASVYIDVEPVAPWLLSSYRWSAAPSLTEHKTHSYRNSDWVLYPLNMRWHLPLTGLRLIQKPWNHTNKGQGRHRLLGF